MIYKTGISFAGPFFFSLSSYAEIFKCVNSQGVVAFQDKECTDGDKLISVVSSEDGAKTIPLDEPKEMTLVKVDRFDGLPVGDNLLKNSKFEDKLRYWIFPTLPKLLPESVMWTSDGGVDNSGALVIQATKPPNDKYIYQTAVEQCVVIGDAVKFILSANYRTTKRSLKGYANRMNIVWHESDDCSAGGQYGGYIEPINNTTDWQQVADDKFTPSLDAKSATIRIVQNGRHSNAAQAVWDDIAFLPTKLANASESISDEASRKIFTLPLGENYIVNGKFKSDVDSWRPSWKTIWSRSEGDSARGAAKVIAVSDDGSIGRGAFNQCVNFGNNTMFESGASFKRDLKSTQKGGGRFRHSWYEKEDCKGRSKTETNHADPQDIAGWQKLKVVGLRAPASARSANIHTIQSVSGNGRFIAYWDDIYFIAVDSTVKK